MEPNLKPLLPQFASPLNPGGMGLPFSSLISPLRETDATSFTALLDLPPPQALDLLANEHFPSNIALIDRADNPAPSSSMKVDLVKAEPSESEHNRNSSSPAVSDQILKSVKRKEREKKGKETNKKSKTGAANEMSDDGSGEKLPYVHVRARRGQATDSHSLAERARREKINAKMKLLQDLVPGCNKISGTAMVLDEITNHVQSLQRQVEFLSMRLAAVNPRIDFNMDTLIAAEIENSYVGMMGPSIWAEGSRRQQQQQQPWTFHGLHHQASIGRVEEETPLLSYDSTENSASQHSGQLKKEL